MRSGRCKKRQCVTRGSAQQTDQYEERHSAIEGCQEEVRTFHCLLHGRHPYRYTRLECNGSEPTVLPQRVGLTIVARLGRSDYTGPAISLPVQN